MAKGKELRRVIDSKIILAKKGGLHSYRQALGFFYDKKLTRSLFQQVSSKHVTVVSLIVRHILCFCGVPLFLDQYRMRNCSRYLQIPILKWPAFDVSGATPSFFVGGAKSPAVRCVCYEGADAVRSKKQRIL